MVLLFFFSYLTVLSSHCAIPISHATVLLLHLVGFFFFSPHIDGSIVTLGSTNITSNYTFVTFNGTLFFFSHLIVLLLGNSIVPPLFSGIRYPLVCNLLYQVTKSSHLTFLSLNCAILTLHVTVFLSHLMVPFLFFPSHLMVSSSHCVVPTSHLIVLLSHLIVLLSHLMVPLFFFLHLTVSSSYYAISISHVTVLLSHLMVPLFFSSHLTVSSSHYTVPTSRLIVLLSHLVVPLFFSYI